jgi:hypothetical protein
VDWTFAASVIGVYVVPAGTCTLDQFNARTCNFLVRSETTTKPRKLSTSNFAAGSYTLLIANFATQDESLSLQLFSKTETCPALAGSGGPLGAAANGTVERVITR